MRSSLISLLAVFAPLAYAQGPLAPVVQPYVDAQRTAGAVVLVGSRDKVVDLETFGFRDLATHTPIQADDLFWIASMTKPVTATAIMMLVDEGKLSVDDPVEKYLPEFRGLRVVATPATDDLPVHAGVATVPASHPILIRECLSHTAGLERYSDLERKDDRFRTHVFTEKDPGPLDAYSLADAVKGYAAMPLRTQPGTQSRYANAGLNIAGRIVEVVSGMSYEKFLETRIFAPLGMTDTTFIPTALQLKRLQTNYTLAPDGKTLEVHALGQLHYPLDDTKTRFPMPAGGLFSTAADMFRFAQMVLNGGVWHGKRIVSETGVHTMTTNRPASKTNTALAGTPARTASSATTAATRPPWISTLHTT